MIDEKGRLFGKINIIDLLVIIILIAAIAFVSIKIVQKNNSVVESGSGQYIVTLNCESTPKFVADILEAQIGKSVYDSDGKQEIGTFESYTISPYMEHLDNGDTYESDYYVGAKLTIKSNAVKSAYGITIGGNIYAPGHTMVVYVGDAKLYLKVESFVKQ